MIICVLSYLIVSSMIIMYQKPHEIIIITDQKQLNNVEITLFY
jgi:hypothetical protein